MVISVFGLGYVGCVSAACLARLGFQVIAVDVNSAKVDAANRGEPSVIEPGLDDLFKAGHRAGLIVATSDPADAIASADVVILAVGTPVGTDGQLDLSSLYAATQEIGLALRESGSTKTIIIRSTVTPGTVERVTRLLSEQSGKVAGVDFRVAVNPEFLREGSAIADFFSPPYILYGTPYPEVCDVMRHMYGGVAAEVRQVSVGTAEMIKYVNNSWHALKVAFANEIGAICREVGTSSHELMSVFADDTTLNTSRAYLRPGFAYGGACLPKDLSGLVALAASERVSVPILDSVRRSNREHVDRALELILQSGTKRVAMWGLAFKPETDDIRNSPALELAHRLVEADVEVVAYDSSVSLALSSGRATKSYRSALGAIDLVPHPVDLKRTADLLVVAKGGKGISDATELGLPILDLVGALPSLPVSNRLTW